MRSRRLSDTGDYTFGQGEANFLIDSVECVAQNVRTRMKLWVGEWFLDVSEGTPWTTEILSAYLYNTKPLLDMAIRTRVLRTPGVVSIPEYQSSVDPTTRRLTVTMRINTTFGEASVQEVV